MQRYYELMIHHRYQYRRPNWNCNALTSFNNLVVTDNRPNGAKYNDNDTRNDTSIEIQNSVVDYIPSKCIIDNVLSITVLCDIIFVMLHPRELITSLTRV
jgi:hypothetical protein